jgi:hexosaminidase
MDGSNPTTSSFLYTDAFPVTKTSTIKAQAFKNGEAVGRISSKTIDLHKAAGKKVTYNNLPNKKYNTSNLCLTDGLRGSADYTKDLWTAFRGIDMDLEIDLGKEENVSTITASFLHSTGSWIFLPINVTFEISADGKTFTEIGVVDYSDIAFEPGKYLKECTISFAEQKVRFIRVLAKSMKVNPQWHTAKGGENWIFIDEVIVN